MPAATAAAGREEAAIGDALAPLRAREELEFPSMVKARVWDAVRREKPTLLDRLRSRGHRLRGSGCGHDRAGLYFGTPIVRDQRPADRVRQLLPRRTQRRDDAEPARPECLAGRLYVVGIAQPLPASYIDTADAATLDGAAGAVR